MLRAFRVFRLFKRIKSLNKIIVSLTNAVPGLINAAIVQFLVMCIYAILGVDLFRDFGADGSFINYQGEVVEISTLRGNTFGDEYYGNFFRSLYTLFQVLTGESWSEIVARPIIMSEGTMGIVASVFYVSYIIICGIILVNVAVAVLLEKMVDVTPNEGHDGIILKDLPEYAATILSVLDTDGDGVLSTTELQKAADLLKKESYVAEHPDLDPMANAKQIAQELSAQMNALRGDSDMTLSRLAQEAPAAADLAALRDEVRHHEAQWVEFQRSEASRQETLMQQLSSLSQGIASLQAAEAARVAAKASRPKRKPPPGYTGTRMPNGSAARSPTTPALRTPAAGAASDMEDRVQDGERTVSKQAPERIQRL